MLWWDLLYPLIGVLAGLLSGLFGIGAGIVVVPALVFVFKLNHFPYEYILRLAAGSSFAIMIFTASSSVYAHRRRGHLDMPVLQRFLPGVLLGVVTGAFFAGQLPTHVMEIILGIFLLLVSAYMFLAIQPNPGHHLPGNFLLFFIAFIIGAKSGLLGIGGGTIIVPFLVYCNISMRDAAGISAACTLPISFVGMAAFILMGWNISSMAYTTGYVYWPAVIGVAIASIIFAPMGTWLSCHIRTAWLKRIFAVLLLMTSLHLLMS